MGLMLVLFNVFVMNWGIPWSEAKFRDLEWRVKNNLTQMVFREGEFTTLKNGITVFVNKHEDDGSVSGIFVSDESKPNVKVTLTAEKGRLMQTPKGPRILFINGVRQEINTKDYKFSTLSFARYSAEFNNVESKKKKNQTVRERSVWELLNAENDTTLDAPTIRKSIVEGHRRILYPLYNLLFALLACVGLLVGNFNRRGQTKLIVIEVWAMIIILGGDLAFTNLLPLLLCFYLLFFYNPFYFRRFRAKEHYEK